MRLHALHVSLVVGIAVAACSTTNDATPSDPENAPPCKNGVRDGDEIGVDCGGSCGTKCDGDECSADTECASGACTEGACAASAGKTCGVGLPNPCADGETCQQDADCATDYCDATCKPPPANVHADGRRNGGETGKDCGGKAKDKPCPAGEKCKVSDDCEGLCDGKVCLEPSPTDGKKNGDETDVDCGGSIAPKCALDKACLANADCELDACTATKCVVPTESDALKNGSETDVDCGGPGVSAGGITYKAPRCTVSKGCGAGADCLTGACSPGGKCELPSCATAETAGIGTCGAKETGQAGAAHESCCKSLILPTRTTRRLDKYEITTGRYRTFITKVGPNIRAWVQTYAAANPTSQLAQLVTSFPAVANLYPAADRFGNMSLTAHLSLDIDNYDGIRGCYNGNGNYSANTYWQDNVHQADYSLPPRSLARTVSDEKPMNCAMPIMYAAFCAWDGGEMARFADYADIWPAAQTFPWGSTNYCTEGGGQGQPGGFKPCAAFNWCNGTYQNGGFLCQNTALSTNGVAGVFYEFPLGTDRSKDNSPLIGAPGRFVQDATLVKSNGESWYDVWANLAEYTGDFATNPNALHSTFCDMSAPPVGGMPTCTRANRPGQTGTLSTGIPQIGLVGQSWEGHQYGRGTAASQTAATFQYGKFGARCVRPAAVY
ncbi:MAG: hypothetical protein KF819_26775 [Labilithrix sp.]|nr:hypothetical protein [Labilithrix sp.]